jgi:hypothetical protein
MSWKPGAAGTTSSVVRGAPLFDMVRSVSELTTAPFGVAIVLRHALAGYICVLLAPSGPLSERGAALVDRLHADLGGQRVEPLHVTVDRVATDDASTLIRCVRESAERPRRYVSIGCTSCHLSLAFRRS